jgi:hypothetical protein
MKFTYAAYVIEYNSSSENINFYPNGDQILPKY